MTLQEQLRKLTTGGPGVAHIASETLFEECAARLDQLETALNYLLAGLVLDLRHADSDDDRDAMWCRIDTVFACFREDARKRQ
jgi:hypothetical protein